MEKRLAVVGVGVCSFVGLLWANKDGALPRKSGGQFPSESVCTECHSSPQFGSTPNRGPGSVTFTVQPYKPGETQSITITVADPAQMRWGFQLTARPANALTTQAGSFRATDSNAQVICDNDSPAPCPAGMLQFATHTLAGSRLGTRTSVSWTVEWTAPATDIGNVIFAAAGNAANGDTQERGDNIYTRQVTVEPGTTGELNPRISQGGVVGAGLSNPVVRQVAANGIVSVFGQDFFPAGQSRLVSGADLVDGKLPENLGGLCVEIGGQKARMFHVFPTQLNVQAPTLTGVGQMPVQVVANCGTATERKSAAETVTVAAVAPDFFYFRGADGRPRVAAINAVTFAAITGAAKPEDILALYSTGLGRVNPAVEAGVLPPGIASTTEPVTVTVGGIQADVLYAGVAPGLAGLYQINIKVPANAPNGDLPVVARIAGVSTPEGAFLTVQR